MQIVVDIPNEILLSKIELFLKKFQSSGVKINKNEPTPKFKSFKYSDDYIENNWKQILMSTQSDSDYYKSEQYYEDRGAYLMDKYK